MVKSYLRNGLIAGVFVIAQAPTFAAQTLFIDQAGQWQTALDPYVASTGASVQTFNFENIAADTNPFIQNPYNIPGFYSTLGNPSAGSMTGLITLPWYLKVERVDEVINGGATIHSNVLSQVGSLPTGTDTKPGWGFVFTSFVGGSTIGGVQAVSFDVGNYHVVNPTFQSILQVKYVDRITGAESFDYASIVKRSDDKVFDNIAVIADMNKVIASIGFYSCTYKNPDTASPIQWLGCSAQASIDNVKVVQAVPEPETYALMVAGLGLLALRARSRRKSAV
jgi:hypothetical protein